MSRYAIILAGGSGIRLWPLSRESLPKQLIPVLNGKSLLEAAFDRLEGVIPPERRWVCGGARYEAIVRSRLPALGRYIGEPEGRDTLAAIALSCALVRTEDPDATVAILTSDHVIEPVDDFRAALDLAFATAESPQRPLVTFGVAPTFAATAYGYLELGSDPHLQIAASESDAPGMNRAAVQSAPPTIRRVRRFREKPDLPTAERFVAAGPARYLWNSGMFVFKASRLLELLAKYEPAIAEAIERIARAESSEEQAALMRDIYPTITKKSVDYGIMEPASQDSDVTIACVPLDLEWKDIGSWNAYGSLASPDSQGNRAMLAAAHSPRRAEGTPTAQDRPETLFVESTGNLAVTTDPSHLIAFLGCKDIVVVHTQDATLVCPKNKVEELKKLYPFVSQQHKE